MKSQRHESFDLAYAGDFAHPDNILSAICDEISSAARAGYSVVLAQMSTAGRRLIRPFDPAIAACIERGEASAAALNGRPVSARLAVFHEPIIPDPADSPSFGLEAEQSLLVVHGPPCDKEKAPRRNFSSLAVALNERVGSSPRLAPAWPSLREPLKRLGEANSVWARDWLPIVDAQRWRCRPACSGLVPLIGRYSQPRPHLWPERLAELLRAYPFSDLVEVRLSGVPRNLLNDLSGQVPSNWVLFEAGTIALQRFLTFLDVYVQSSNPNWPCTPELEALQALAGRVVAVLPAELAEYFGQAAIYSSDGAVDLEAVTRLHRDRSAFDEQARLGRRLVEERHDPRLHLERLRELIGKPKHGARTRSPVQQAARRGRPKSAGNVLFTASNGIGLGHLVQLMAVAKHLPPHIRPVFATMSQAISIVRSAGFAVHYIPGERYLNARSDHWNAWLEHEVARLIAFHDACGLVFSGVWCYDGILLAGARRAGFPMAWLRIPMWKRQLWDSSVQRARYFDLVLDAGEIAQARNVGARIPYEDRVHAVPPILFCDREEWLSREAARARLGLDPDRPAVLLQLGAGNNQVLHPIIDHMLSVLARMGPYQVVIAEWVNADHVLDSWPGVKVLRDFPNAKFLPAFDFVVSASGYNTFHEMMAGGIPTVFVPSENQETDDQLGRAQFAQEEGLGLCVRASEIEGFEEAVVALADPATRMRIAESCRRRWPENGARFAADRIADLIQAYDSGGATATRVSPTDGIPS